MNYTVLVSLVLIIFVIFFFHGITAQNISKKFDELTGGPAVISAESMSCSEEGCPYSAS